MSFIKKVHVLQMKLYDRQFSATKGYKPSGQRDTKESMIRSGLGNQKKKTMSRK